MELTSYGAAGEVTGSKHLLTVNGKGLLLDCGMFQGAYAEVAQKNANFPFSIDKVDAVILSHGHLDHCGSLPLLVRAGYRGAIYSTPATKDVAECIMRDSAHIQLQDADYHNKYRKPGSAEGQPLYLDRDVDAALRLMQPIPYWKPFEPLSGVKATFFDAGHILGSALTHLTMSEENRTVRFGYSGDLGHKDMPILRNPEILPTTDILLLESTYGNKSHETLGERTDKLIQVVLEAIRVGGKIIVPAFALGRMQTLIYTLHALTDSGKIPRIPIYIDSPLGERLTAVFEKHQECYDEETKKLFTSRHDDPFGFRNLQYVQSVEESKALNMKSGPMIIVASSGMVEAGRVLHHLKNALPDPKNTVLIVGYMAAGTRGRKLLEGASSLSFFGLSVPVRAKVLKINAYSAHADEHDLLEFLAGTSNLRKLFLVHGDATVSADFAETVRSELPSIDVTLPEAGRAYAL
ncbi:MAG: MBL fold metallo-hydrolase [Patescibacteria group bacterium]|jgi:metallo-beta-lactamase family protein